MKIWTPPMLRHLKFIVWSIFSALDQSFWLLELQVMTLQSGVPSQFWHFFNNLEKILSFFSLSSFASNLDFLDFWWSKWNSNFIFMILGPKCSGLTKNPKKSNFDWQLTFYLTIPNLPFSEGSCDCDVILIWLGHLRVKSVMSLRIFCLFPQIPDLPLLSRWI